ncbi:hypothetical protein FRX31_021238, partial [Thalictrum thalictroides]
MTEEFHLRKGGRSGDTSISHLRVGDRIIESVGIRGEGLSALDHLRRGKLIDDHPRFTDSPIACIGRSPSHGIEGDARKKRKLTRRNIGGPGPPPSKASLPAR